MISHIYGIDIYIDSAFYVNIDIDNIAIWFHYIVKPLKLIMNEK